MALPANSMQGIKIDFDPHTSPTMAKWAQAVSDRIDKSKGRVRANTEDDPPSTRLLDQREAHVVVRDDGFNFGSMLVGEDAVWMSASTYDAILSDGDMDWQFSAALQEWRPGMKYLLEDTSGAFSNLQKDARAKGAGTTDPLTQLEQDARALLVSIATVEGDLSELQVRMFAERLADVRGRYAIFEAVLEEVESHAELASVAMMEAL